MARLLIGNVRHPLINNLTTDTPGSGALDAAQGKVLEGKKIDKTNIVNNLTTTVENMVLDARQGKVLKDGQDELNRNIEVTFLDKNFGGVVGCPLYYCKYTKILYCSTVIMGTFANGANMGTLSSSQVDMPNSVRQIPFVATNTDGSTSYAQLSISTSGNISLHNSVDKAMLNPVISGFCLLGYI